MSPGRVAALRGYAHSPHGPLRARAAPIMTNIFSSFVPSLPHHLHPSSQPTTHSTRRGSPASQGLISYHPVKSLHQLDPPLIGSGNEHIAVSGMVLSPVMQKLSHRGDDVLSKIRGGGGGGGILFGKEGVRAPTHKLIHFWLCSVS